ncbi:MAG: hypothetical protein H7A45_01385 [Verrucomicrobiales bacterium]|nr:hypothetical protein [Verrucomicrobiales bacterium]
MRDRWEPILKLACALLAGLLLFQLAGLTRSSDPLQGVDLPNLAALRVSSHPPPPDEADEPDTGRPPGRPTGLPPGFPGGAPPEPLPTNIQNQVDTILQSEILGRLPRPQPLMFLGLAGQHAFLQTPSGQSGIAAEGEEIGGVKVLRIGANRVLVEVEGKPQELVLFPGLPGESLMPATPSPAP